MTVSPEAGDVNTAVAAPGTFTFGVHPAAPAQFGWSHAREAVLRHSAHTNQRALVALHLILTAHAPVPALSDEGVHLTCTACRPEGREPAEQYPCPSARHALDTLQASLAPFHSQPAA